MHFTRMSGEGDCVRQWPSRRCIGVNLLLLRLEAQLRFHQRRCPKNCPAICALVHRPVVYHREIATALDAGLASVYRCYANKGINVSSRDSQDPRLQSVCRMHDHACYSCKCRQQSRCGAGVSCVARISSTVPSRIYAAYRVRSPAEA